MNKYGLFKDTVHWDSLKSVKFTRGLFLTFNIVTFKWEFFIVPRLKFQLRKMYNKIYTVKIALYVKLYEFKDNQIKF